MLEAVVTAPPPERGRAEGRGQVIARTVGEILITFGLVMLLFVVYQVYWTNWISAGKQGDATSELDQEWQDEAARGQHFGVADGKGIAKLYIPALGADYHFTIIEGASDKNLTVGPAHYSGTALPGQPGNFAVAGHRVGKGAPFNDLDLVQSCDAIIVETADSYYVYRMLPTKTEQRDWQRAKAGKPNCAVKTPQGIEDVNPLGGEYTGLVGQEIVPPTRGDVISPVPGKANSQLPKASQAALLTLTTCHPKFSDRERLILHAVFVMQWRKDSRGTVPPEMKETG
jgi:LPXTG-site transpeptidase (sortase) family protein